jgi:hypothetical protein
VVVRLVVALALALGGCGRFAFEDSYRDGGESADANDGPAGDGGMSVLVHALGASGGTVSDTPPVDTTGAVVLVACVSTFYISISTANVTDNYGNTWTEVIGKDSVNLNNLNIYIALSPMTGTNHIFEGTGGDGYATIGVVAFAGPPLALQGGVAAMGASTSSVQTGLIVPDEPGELFVACVGANSHTNWTAVTISDMFSIVDEQLLGAPTSPEELAVAWMLEGGAQSINPTWTVTGSDIAMNAVAIGFKHP